MKKTSMAIALAAVIGLTLAAVPALAAGERVANEQSVACPFHDGDAMTYEDMNQWMGSGHHQDWMNSADHDRVHAQMGGMPRMMDGSRVGPGTMSGMMGGGHMAGLSG